MSSVAELREVVGGLAGNLDALDGRQLGALLQDLERLARTLEHAIVTVVGEADRRDVWAEDGHRSVRGWCMATANWSWAETTARLRTTTLLTDLDRCDEALAAGEVGVAQVRELARARADPRCGDQLADAHELLMRHAKLLPFDDFRRVVQRWEALADVDGAHRDHETAHHNRKADVELIGPELHLDARGGAAQGAAIRRSWSASPKPSSTPTGTRPRPATATTRTSASSPAPPPSVASMPFTRSSSPPPPPRPTPKPPSRSSVSSSTRPRSRLPLLTPSAIARSGHDATAADPTARRCETIDGNLLDPLDVLTAAVVGHVRRVVYDSASTTIDLGRASRLFTGALPPRRVAPGHAMYLARLRAPPLPDRPRHGVDRPRRTQPANAAPLCGWHNRWKTRGYRTWRDPDGIWHTYRPDGTEIKAA